MSPLHELPGSEDVEEGNCMMQVPLSHLLHVYIPWSLKIVMLLETITESKL
jgi:hypothetical protein